MEKLFDVAAGIDVHRDTVVVSVRRRNGKVLETIGTRTFETFYDGLVAMTDWLSDLSVEVIGLESTGVYWRPVVRVLHERLTKAVVWLVNPNQVRKVPGRKTDVSDSEWLARLAMFGLVAPSFLPPAQIQELRELTRHRTKVLSDRARYSNRIIKQLESSGFKLASVCSDVFGKTGRALVDTLVDGKALSLDEVRELAHGALRDKAPQLHRAIRGGFTPAVRVALLQMLRALDMLNGDVANLDAEIARRLSPLRDDVALLTQIPGINEISAAVIIAESGSDMSVFPSPRHLASWGGLSPGSEESAGTRKKSPTRKGNKYFRTALVQSAMAAKNQKGSFWHQKYRRLARLGPKKAAVALARSLTTVVYKLLKDRVAYVDPISIPPPPHRRDAALRRLTAQIRTLGYSVTFTALQPCVS